MVLEGKVIKGFGRAKIFVNMVEEAFYKKTKMRLYPGTLNIKLEEPYNLKLDYLIKAEEYGGSFNVQVQKCKVYGKDAYIVRSEKNTLYEADYTKEIIEIVSDISFREEYSLKDNQKIEIQI